MSRALFPLKMFAQYGLDIEGREGRWRDLAFMPPLDARASSRSLASVFFRVSVIRPPARPPGGRQSGAGHDLGSVRASPIHRPVGMAVGSLVV